MRPSIWNDILTEEDQLIITVAGYDGRGASTFDSRRGGDKPALLVIDMQRLFVGDDVPTHQAIKTAPSMIGERGWRAIEHILPLAEQCRAQGIPVVYAVMQPYNRPANNPLLAIVDPLRPQPDDIVLKKSMPSVFFQSQLGEMLLGWGCDSVILVGNSTSGCIRATAVDALQHGLGVYVPYECVFDRIQASHKIGLLDMWMKVAIVLPVSELMALFNRQTGEQPASGSR